MMPKRESYDVLVIGGGFFGLNIAEHFARQGRTVLICEQAETCMTRASYVNQARVHNGYHYPRSILTALRSHVSFPRFVAEFGDCVKSDYSKYYGIGTILGKVTALQFKTFCDRIGAECEDAESRVARLFSSHYIEKVFKVKEYAFDAVRLREIMMGRIVDCGADVWCGTRVRQVVPDLAGRGLWVSCCNATSTATFFAAHVFNCTYSNLNAVNRDAGVEFVPLKYEMTEMALVRPPEVLMDMGITIMCGPFFSIMPFPPEGLHSLSHVRYTPHFEWADKAGADYVSPQDVYEYTPRMTAYSSMIRDATRYLAVLEKCQYVKSIWEVKTVLPSSEVDDSRPILFKMNHGFPGFHCVMGGKIDNVYDVLEAIEQNKEVFA